MWEDVYIVAKNEVGKRRCIVSRATTERKDFAYDSSLPVLLLWFARHREAVFVKPLHSLAKEGHANVMKKVRVSDLTSRLTAHLVTCDM